MKKIILFFLITHLASTTQAQNVGIGTTTPQRQLHIVDSTLNPNLTIESPSITLDKDVTLELKQANGAGDWLRLKKYSFSSAETFAGVPLANASTLFSGLDGGDLKIGALRASSAVDLFAGGQRRMLINPNGNVGIGDVNPQALLHVKSFTGEALRVQAPAAYMSFYDNANYSGYLQSANNTMALASVGSNKLSLVTNFTERITALQNGNVGINNNNPSANFHVTSTLGEAMRIQAPSAFLSFYDNTNYTGYLQSAGNTMSLASQGANRLSLVTSFTERLTITPSGNIGINKTAPTATLDVNGFSRLGSEAEGAPKIKTKIITSTMGANDGDSKLIPHGLNAASILSVDIFVSISNGYRMPPNWKTQPTNYEYSYFLLSDGTNIWLKNIPGNSSALSNQPVTIFITYTE